MAAGLRALVVAACASMLAIAVLPRAHTALTEPVGLVDVPAHEPSVSRTPTPAWRVAGLMPGPDRGAAVVGDPLGGQCVAAEPGWRHRPEFHPVPCPARWPGVPHQDIRRGEWPASMTRDLGSRPTGFAFYHRDADGRGAFWDTCRPLRIRLNLGQVPHEQRSYADAAVRDVLAYVTRETGVRLDVIGTTTIVPLATPGWATERVQADTDAVIGFAPRHAVRETDEHPAVTAISVTAGRDGRPSRLLRGGVLVSTDVLGWKNPVIVRSILLHEAGHLLGLGHTTSDNQAMNVANSAGLVVALQDGDRAGIAALQDQHPCEGS